MIDINIIRPVRKMVEGSEYKPSIIAYDIKEYFTDIKDGEIHRKYYIYINLYLVEIRLDFVIRGINKNTSEDRRCQGNQVEKH